MCEVDQYLLANYRTYRDKWHSIQYLYDTKQLSQALDGVDCIVWYGDRDEQPPSNKDIVSRYNEESMMIALWHDRDQQFIDTDGDPVLTWELDHNWQIWFKLV